MDKDANGSKYQRFIPSMGNVLTLLAMLLAGFGSWTVMSKDVTEVKTRVEYIEKNSQSQEKTTYELKQEIKGDIKEVKESVRDLNRKIDLLIERPATVMPMRRGIDR